MDENLILCVCSRGNIDALHLFIKKFQFPENVCEQDVNTYWNDLIANSCKNKNAFMVMWLLDRFPEKEIPFQCREFVEMVQKENEREIEIKPASKKQRHD